MGEVGIDLAAHRSESVADIDPDEVDIVITLCADEVCPAFLGGVRRLHWPFPDPAGHDESGTDSLRRFRDTRDAIAARLRHFLAEETLLAGEA
jgi:arsenate reductase